MADYWKSQPKKFCQYCKCWIADNKPSVEFHERGKNHKENVAAKIAEIKKKSIDKAKQEDRMSKEFAAMEEAAMKAFQADLKRLEAESATTEAQHAKPAPKAEAASSSATGAWLEGVSEEGHTYYYNTLTGESQWEKPKGFRGKENKSKQRQANKKPPKRCPWNAAQSPEGYTYYYNTETGESSWERPGGYRSPERTAESGNTPGQEGPPPPLPDPPTAEGESAEKPALGPEGGRAPQVAKISFRKRKLDGPPEGGAEEADGAEDDGKEEAEDTREEPAPCDDKKEEEEEEKEVEKEENKEEVKEKEEKKKEEVVVVVKKPRKTNPYGAWEQIQEEKDPYEDVDLQLPKVDGGGTAPAPSELPPEPKVKFRERTITSLGDESGAGTVFRKRRAENGKSRSLRQRAGDD
ncbi:WW domain-binding protein 4 [Conger conger]|uniref:WW domain-binding protein 4 n=1 Tax=Conger conger TaxID=82655 RepID=UPI002A5A7A4F|nr:WW domain-binding protein 4 [Conger conger]